MLVVSGESARKLRIELYVMVTTRDGRRDGMTGSKQESVDTRSAGSRLAGYLGSL